MQNNASWLCNRAWLLYSSTHAGTRQRTHSQTQATQRQREREETMHFLWICVCGMALLHTCYARYLRSNAVLDMSGEIMLELNSKTRVPFGGFGVSTVKYMTGSNSVCQCSLKTNMYSICSIYIYMLTDDDEPATCAHRSACIPLKFHAHLLDCHSCLSRSTKII